MTTNKDELKAIFFSFYDQLKPEHAEKAKANYDEDWAPKWGEPKSHDDAVNFSCDWSKTTEGFTYWDNIHDDLMDESYPLQLTPQVCKDKAKEHLYGKDTTNSKMPAHEWFKYLKPEHKEAALTLPHDMGVDGELFECLADSLYSKDWCDSSEFYWSDIYHALIDGTYHTESAESAERMATPEELEDLESICLEAYRIQGGDRQQDYGSPAKNFEDIAGLWNSYISATGRDKLEARDVAHMMILMKVSRNIHKPKRDNWVDMAGYAQCGGKVDGL